VTHSYTQCGNGNTTICVVANRHVAAKNTKSFSVVIERQKLAFMTALSSYEIFCTPVNNIRSLCKVPNIVV